MIFLRPLTPADLGSTSRMVSASFPTDVGYRWALPMCAMPGRFASVRRAAGLRSGRQWIVPAGSDVTAATFGLFTMDDAVGAPDGCVVLNWFCVDPAYRGSGLGRALWEAVVAEARALGGTRLVFYSSTEPHHAAADALYRRMGCARRPGPVFDDAGHRLLSFEFRLHPACLHPDDSICRAESAAVDAAMWHLYRVDSAPDLVREAEHILAEIADPVAVA